MAALPLFELDALSCSQYALVERQMSNEKRGALFHTLGPLTDELLQSLRENWKDPAPLSLSNPSPTQIGSKFTRRMFGGPFWITIRRAALFFVGLPSVGANSFAGEAGASIVRAFPKKRVAQNRQPPA
jgi:hypothetical protein